MTELELKAIRERLAAASPGPWSTNIEIDDSGIEDPDGYTICHIQHHGSINTVAREGGQHFSHNDAIFIANTPTDIKALLDKIDRIIADNHSMIRATSLLNKALNDATDTYDELHSQLTQAQAENEVLKEDLKEEQDNHRITNELFEAASMDIGEYQEKQFRAQVENSRLQDRVRELCQYSAHTYDQLTQTQEEADRRTRELELSVKVQIDLKDQLTKALTYNDKLSEALEQECREVHTWEDAYEEKRDQLIQSQAMLQSCRKILADGTHPDNIRQALREALKESK